MRRYWRIMLVIAAIVVPPALGILFGESPQPSPLAEGGSRWLIWIILLATFVFSGILLALGQLRHQILKKPAGHPPDGGDFPPSSGQKVLSFFLELVRDIGIGGIVGCVVAGTFELALHRQAEREYEEKLEKVQREHQQQLEKVQGEHQQHLQQADLKYNQRLDEINKDVFKATFGVFLDEQLRKEIGDTIFQYPHLVREKLTLRYDFEAAEDGSQPVGAEKLLDLTVTLSYHLRNTGVAPKEHTISPSFEELPTLGPAVGQFLGLDVEDFMGEPIHLKGANLTQFEKQKRSLRDFPDGVRIKIDHDQAARVKWVYKTKRRYADKFTFVTVLPARNWTLIAKKGKGVADLEFVPDTAHRVQHPEPKKPKPGEPPPADGEYIWAIEAAFLPYQGIIFDWYPASKVPKP
jgi:hypothetical protein